MTYWDHLEELRWTLLRSIGVLLVLFVCLFFCKEFLFDTVVLSPATPDFWLYKLLGVNLCLHLVNIEVTAQFFIHLRVSFMAALILGFPYICFEFWRFVSPALYQNEKSAVRRAFALGGGLFYVGVAVGYFLVLPLVLFFFNAYQVSSVVENTFSLSSYISIFTGMVLMMGLLFEFPSVIAVLSQLGVVQKSFLKNHRKHALVLILIVAAVLTPTGDPFTLLVVSLPLYGLYEFSIILCKR